MNKNQLSYIYVDEKIRSKVFDEHLWDTREF